MRHGSGGESDRDIKQRAEIIKKEMLAPDIYMMSLKAELREESFPGQFVMIFSPDRTRLLGRPLCIADASKETVTVVFRASGNGTRGIAACETGDHLYIEGPLGKGYPYDDTINGKKTVLLCGGLGAPSLLYLAKKLSEAGMAGQCLAVMGYRDSSQRHFLADEFSAYGIRTVISTDDGSEGVRGNVLDALEETGEEPELIYACGPLPMLSGVKRYADSRNIKAYISMEEHMACGIGVCLGCVVKTDHRDGHSNVNNARVCTEGPVFDAAEISI